MIDEKTTNYSFPLPNIDNLLEVDVERIKKAFIMTDEQVHKLFSEREASDNKSDKSFARMQLEREIDFRI